MTGRIWAMEQVRQVQGLRARCLVDLQDNEQSQGVAAEVAGGKMVRKLIDMAHPFAVEPHPDDFDFLAERPVETPWALTLSCRWAPRTNAAVLLGGPRDGERWAMQRVGEPFRVEVLATTPWFDTDDTHAEAAVTSRTVTYELAGWHETERCWIYEYHSDST